MTTEKIEKEISVGGIKFNMDTNPYYRLVNTKVIPMDFDKKIYTNRLLRIFKNEHTGEMLYDVLEDPEVSFYVSKPEFPEQFVRMTKPIEECNLVTCKQSKITETIASMCGLKDEYDKLKKLKSGSQVLKRFHKNPNVFSSDVNIEDFYMLQQTLTYGTNAPYRETTMGFWDIEVNSDGFDGFPEEDLAPCPINILSYFHAPNKTFYVFALSYDDNQSFDEFVENYTANHEAMINGIKERHGIDVEIEFQLFNSEIDLISTFWEYINYFKTEYVLAANARFDILTVINRIKVLGYDPNEIIVPVEFRSFAHIDYYKDKRSPTFIDRGDYFQYTGYSKFLCSITIYSNLRKAAGKLDSYSLDFIAGKELKVGKNDIDIKHEHRLNYFNFVYYNLIDTLLLYLLENKTGDVGLMENLALITNSRYYKAFKKTVVLPNWQRLLAFMDKQAYFNNHNTSYGEDSIPTPGIRGGFVGNPNLINKIGRMINGIFSNKALATSIDIDFGSLYPNLTMILNACLDTMVFKIGCIKRKGTSSLGMHDKFTYYERDEKGKLAIDAEKYSQYALDTSYFIDGYLSKNRLQFANQYLDFTTTEDLLKEIEEFKDELK